MLPMPPKEPASSTVVQHSDGVSNTHIRRVDHHVEIPRESYVELTTLECTSTAQGTGQTLFRLPSHFYRKMRVETRISPGAYHWPYIRCKERCHAT